MVGVRAGLCLLFPRAIDISNAKNAWKTDGVRIFSLESYPDDPGD